MTSFLGERERESSYFFLSVRAGEGRGGDRWEAREKRGEMG